MFVLAMGSTNIAQIFIYQPLTLSIRLNIGLWQEQYGKDCSQEGFQGLC